MDAIATATSGLQAASQRVAQSAQNVANVNNRAPLPAEGEAYQGYEPGRITTSSQEPGGVRAQSEPVRPAYRPTPALGDPGAEAEARPNVNLAEEAVTQMTASHAYEANARVIETANEMTGTLLNTLG